MAEIKRGYRQGDWQAREETKKLRGVSWEGWKSVLENRLRDQGLTMPNSDTETILHAWFILRHLRKLWKINEHEFDERKEKLFADKDEDFFNDPSVMFSIGFITNRTERVLKD